MTDFQLGDQVRMPHPAGGWTVPARIVAFRPGEARVESVLLQNWTAWWPVDKLELYHETG